MSQSNPPHELHKTPTPKRLRSLLLSHSNIRCLKLFGLDYRCHCAATTLRTKKLCQARNPFRISATELDSYASRIEDARETGEINILEAALHDYLNALACRHHRSREKIGQAVFRNVFKLMAEDSGRGRYAGGEDNGDVVAQEEEDADAKEEDMLGAIPRLNKTTSSQAASIVDTHSTVTGDKRKRDEEDVSSVGEDRASAAPCRLQSSGTNSITTTSSFHTSIDFLSTPSPSTDRQSPEAAPASEASFTSLFTPSPPSSVQAPEEAQHPDFTNYIFHIHGLLMLNIISGLGSLEDLKIYQQPGNSNDAMNRLWQYHFDSCSAGTLTLLGLSRNSSGSTATSAENDDSHVVVVIAAPVQPQSQPQSSPSAHRPPNPALNSDLHLHGLSLTLAFLGYGSHGIGESFLDDLKPYQQPNAYNGVTGRLWQYYMERCPGDMLGVSDLRSKGEEEKEEEDLSTDVDDGVVATSC